MNVSMLVRGKYLPREKAKEEMEKVESPIGVHLAMNSGSETVAHKGFTVRSIIQGEPGRCAICDSTRHYLNVHVQSSLKPRMPSGMTPPGSKKKSNGRSLHGRQKSTKLRASLREKIHQDRLRRDRLSPNLLKVTEPDPKPNLKPVPA